MFSEKNFFLKRQYLVRANNYFETHGGKSIFTSQFLGPLRSVVPLVAGMAEMSYVKFFSWTLIGNLAWAVVYMVIGYVFGASWEAINLWGTRLTIFILVMVVLSVLNWIVGRFLVQHERQVRTIIYSIGQSIVAGFLSNEYVAQLLKRYPNFFRFFKNRLTLNKVFGLPFTLALLLSLALLFYLMTLIRAVIVAGPLLDIDHRLLAAITFVRDPALNYLVYFITNLAGPMIAILVSGMAVYLWLDGRDYRLYVFLIGTSLVYALQYGLKLVFNRARPDQLLALVTESSPGFPSGHAVMALVVFGFLFFALAPKVRNWRLKIAGVLLFSTIILLIGFSRVYLGVHWPSDILGGYLLGAWWLTIMLTIAYLGERTFYAARPSRLSTGWKYTISLVVVIVYLLATGFYTQRTPMRIVERDAISVLPKISGNSFATRQLLDIPRQTETLVGRPQAPINLVFIGSRADIEKIFAEAGWQIADPINLATTLKTIEASIQNQSYPTAPFSPQFYDGRVQDMGFQKSTEMASVRQRHHVRLWLAPISLKSNEWVWVASASLDTGVAYSEVLKFPTHIIDPDIDKERDFIRDDLVNHKAVTKQETVQLVDPVLGRTGAGSPFFTDGKTHVLWFKPRP